MRYGAGGRFEAEAPCFFAVCTYEIETEGSFQNVRFENLYLNYAVTDGILKRFASKGAYKAGIVLCSRYQPFHSFLGLTPVLS